MFASIASDNFKTLSRILWGNKQVGIVLIRYLEQQSGIIRLVNYLLSYWEAKITEDNIEL